MLCCIGSSVAQQCDIVVQGTPTITPNPVAPGVNITVGYVIHNNGPANAGSSQTKIQIKTLAGALITSATFSDPSINANANSPTQTGTVLIPASTPVGTYNCHVILDNLSQLNQSNTANDFTPPVSFSVASSQCDIVVQGIPTITPNPVAPGVNITVGYVIHNNGPANAGSSQTKIQIKTLAGALITSATFPAPAVGANANSPTQSNSVLIPVGTPTGTYNSQVILDNLGVLIQSNTANDFTPPVNFTIATCPTPADLGFMWPMSGSITQACSSQHHGLDISSTTMTFPLGQVDQDSNGYPEVRGAPVCAAAAGTVTQVVSNFPACAPNNACIVPLTPCAAPNGNFVRIAHANGYTSVYCHLFGVDPLITVGRCVQAGDPIGFEGNTGNVCQSAGSSSLGKHLHWEVQLQGAYQCLPGQPQQQVSQMTTAAWVASFHAHGAGCAGPNGVPTLAALAGSRPLLASTFQVRFGGLPNPPSSLGVFAAIGFNDQVWNAQQLPLSLGAYGLPGCMLRVDPVISVVLPNLGGFADWNIAVPANLTLQGLHFYLQGGVVTPGANPAGMVLSDSRQGVFGGV